MFCLTYPVGIYMLKINNKITRAMLEICPKRIGLDWHRAIVIIINFERISDIVLVFPLLLWTNKFRLG